MTPVCLAHGVESVVLTSCRFSASHFKALDGRGLMRKWAEEAQLDAGDDLDACIRCVVASCGCSTASN
jgi:hypothetical protein